MSASAARRRKQLAARKAQQQEGGENTILKQIEELLKSASTTDDGGEAASYEALQLAQSQILKKNHLGDSKGASSLAYSTSLELLKNGHISVASQLLMLLIQVLRETHTEETGEWIQRMEELHAEHQKAMNTHFVSVAGKTQPQIIEMKRLQKLQRDWLRRCVHWSSELGPIRFGQQRLQQLLGQHCWDLAIQLSNLGDTDTAATQPQHPQDAEAEDYDPVMTVMDLKCDAIIHMALAEKPLLIIEWLKTLKDPTKEEITTGHLCPPAERDALLTRALLCFVAIENLRDANVLIRNYAKHIEKRSLDDLKVSYVNKDDNMSPSHVMFGCMLLRVVEKDARTGPLYSWLLRSFKRELDMLHKPQIINSYTTKIGSKYFNIQPPPSMMNMMENMMNMMGGGGGGGGGLGGAGGLGGLNPQMMQALAAQMQQGGMM